MKPKKRQKLCYSCEGEVDLDVIVCPFCAADLREEKPELERNAFRSSIASLKQLHTENSLYPLYTKESSDDASPSLAANDSMMQNAEEEKGDSHSFEEAPIGAKSLLFILFAFTLGAQLFMLGVLLLLFSDQGVLMLKWDAKFWFLYIIVGAPLLFFGYRYIR